MKLYHAPGSCSQAICIVLREAQFDAQIVTVDARRHRFDDGRDYRAVNELGYVPLLVLDDGTTLREGPVIAQYLADRRPEAGLAPAYGTLARYRLMEWLNFLGTEIHKGFIPLLYAAQAGKYVDPVRRKLDSRFAWIDRQLDGHTYLTGDTFTIADAYLFALTGWGKAGWLRSVYDADIELSRHANLRSWYERVRARAAVQQVLQADGLANAA